MKFYYSRPCKILLLLICIELLSFPTIGFAEPEDEDAWMEIDNQEIANYPAQSKQHARFFKRRSDTSLSCSAWKKRISWLSRRQHQPSTDMLPDVQNVSYGNAPLQTMDVYLPNNAQNHPSQSAQLHPVIVMVHGGGWCVGDKAMPKVVSNKLAWAKRRNMIFISINYPMVDEGSDALTQGHHIAASLHHIQQHVSEWGGDTQRMILMGHSAGAHLVSLVNASAQLRRNHQLRPWLATISLDAGAIDVVKQMPQVYPFLKQRYLEAFGPSESSWKLASPYHQLSAGATPWLGVCSTQRKDNPCQQAESYNKKSESLGIVSQVLPLAKSHGEINNDLGLDNRYTRSVEQFINQVASQSVFD